MALSAAGCEASCADGTVRKGVPKQMVPTKRAGPMPTLLSLGSLACNKPMSQHVSPLAGNTTDWRAGCGRPARPVRREGVSKPIDAPYPYSIVFALCLQIRDRRDKPGDDAHKRFKTIEILP